MNRKRQMIRKYFLIIFLACFSMLTISSPIQAQELDSAGVSLEKLEKYISSVLDGKNNQKIHKWARPIRYKIVGLKHEQNVSYIRELFSRIKDITNLDIDEFSEEAYLSGGLGFNILFYFVPNYSDHLGQGDAKEIFKVPGEADDAYLSRVQKADKNGTVALKSNVHAKNTIYVHSAAIKSNDIPKGKLKQHFDLMIISSLLTPTSRSDEVGPSVFNIDIGQQDGNAIPVIDQALLAAVYSDNIKHGMDFKEAIPLIAKKMIQYMKDIEKSQKATG